MATATPVRGQDDLSDQFLKCRTWRHAWDEFTPLDMQPPAYGWRESLRCTRCRTERHRIIDRKGAISSVSYYYPEGYQMKGVGRLEGSDLRTTLFSRMREQLELSQAISAAMNGLDDGKPNRRLVLSAKVRRGA